MTEVFIWYSPNVFIILGSDFSLGFRIGEKLQLLLGVDDLVPVGVEDLVPVGVDDFVLGDGTFPLMIFWGGVALWIIVLN